METETIPTPTATLSAAPYMAGTPEFLILRDGRALVLTRDDLQAIVQQAYDQHGILAAPSYTAESGWEGRPHGELVAFVHAVYNTGARA